MEKKYYTTIGLEIHAELSTKTKMFCSCKNDPDEIRPNINICPVCMAHPGALPVPNKQAIERVIKVGLSLGSKISNFSEFDRKNYFYPDIPKGYQISQYKFPIVLGGELAGMKITRIHLEEDTANNKHFDDITESYSLVDFNRAGVPLMELVTEAHTFENSKEAAGVASNFAKELQLLLWYLGVSEANMEKGEMRVEANVSVSKEKDKLSKNYVEVKNLNSFRSVEKAILYEVERMINLIENDKEEEIIKETRGWDETKQKTFSQRKKESSEDYRYFPDPDLPKMKLHEAFDLEKMKEELPETPKKKRQRYKKDFELKDEDVEIFLNDLELAKWFEEVADTLKDKDKIKLASNYIVSDYLGLKKNMLEISLPKVPHFVELINMLKENQITSRVAKDILALIVEKDVSPLQVAKEKNLLQENNEEELKKIVEKIINQNDKIVETYKSGKENALMALVGQVMKETKGSANPQIVLKLLKENIK